ncbi:competence protein ComEC [Sulfurivirga caldicuralii]|uniref:Competence protein ComEC n=1 Tax=Sulfurivirga caldicuralii TaxID=364032 RepID=A0A1N6F5Y3_9GAMM|nr:DNA internalization-related competence protein ComEC/Rec2 [Sulfurivirga caldicuralii]SIN90660.1 competence protein ComEC [Sulfurivirga caldicuralii]
MFVLFVAGTLLALTAWFTLAPELAVILALGGAGILTVLAVRFRAVRAAVLNLAAGLSLGLVVGIFWMAQHPALPAALVGKPIELQGTVVSLPEAISTASDRIYYRFIFKIDAVGNDVTVPQALLHQRVQLNWRNPPQLEPGQHWHLLVRLYPVHGMLNPGGFDYEAWALTQGWRMRGTVAGGKLLGQTWHWQRLRQAFSERVANAWQSSPYAGFYDALTFGERSRLTPAQWQVLQQTGTTHLMAISGLHIGLAAALGAGLFALLWRFIVPVQRLARPQWAALGAVVFAAVYLWLSGAALPAQRAFLMVGVAVGLVWLRRPFLTFNALALAALLIVLWQPASVLSASFWLSFTAVAVIVLTLQNPWVKARPGWQQFLIVQLALLLALWPLTAFFFNQAAGWRGLINLIAVPLVSFFYLPMLLLGAMLGLIAPQTLQAVSPWLDPLWAPFWQLLEGVTQQPAGIALPPPRPWMLVLFMVVLVAWALKRYRVAAGVAALFTALWLSLPLWLSRPHTGQLWVTVLDVGQGQAVVLETRHHVLVYDLGPRWERLDTGASVVVPFLHDRGHFRVDRLIASHDDVDHAGGLAALRRAFPQARVYSGQPERFEGALACKAGEAWQWDGVDFRFLWPPQDFHNRQDNAHSCVLQVSVGQTRLLLTGDLPTSQERALIRRHGEQLRSVWMLAGHHGSAHSNSAQLLDTVRLRQVAVSAGYRNFYHFPSSAAKVRWLQRDIAVHCTGCEGALQYHVDASGVQLVRRERWARRTIFRHYCNRSLP